MRHWHKVILLSLLSFWTHICVSQNCPSGSILFKEDFGGNEASDPVAKATGVSFVSGLSYNENPCDYSHKGRYAIRKVGYQPHYEWYTMYDHTFPDDESRGYFMQIDASENPCTFFQTQIDGLCESTNLYLSMWAMGSTQLPGYENAYLKLVVENLSGEILASKSIVVENCKGYWEQFGLPFTVPAGDQTIVFKIINTTTSADGNDFCLDDIEIRLCTEVPVISSNQNPACVGTEEILSVSYENDGTLVEPLQYTWFKSAKHSYDSKEWTRIGTMNNLTIPSVSVEDGAYYRVMVSGSDGSTDWNNCSPISEIYKLDVKSCDFVVKTISDTLCEDGALAAGISVDTTYEDNLLIRNEHVVLPLESETVKLRMCQTDNYEDAHFAIPYNHNSGNFVMIKESRDDQNCYKHILDLRVDSVYNVELSDTICSGEEYWFSNLAIKRSGVYRDTVIGSCGCDSVTTLHLFVAESQYKTIEACTQEDVPYFMFGNYYTETGVYEERLVNRYGCDSITVLKLTVESVKEEIIPYEYFTPDNDGVHERWRIQNIEMYPDARVKIYDRYGKLLYEKVSYQNEMGWDGVYNGVVMPSSDYWYVINVPTLDKQYTGHFTLIRGNNK